MCVHTHNAFIIPPFISIIAFCLLYIFSSNLYFIFTFLFYLLLLLFFFYLLRYIYIFFISPESIVSKTYTFLVRKGINSFFFSSRVRLKRRDILKIRFSNCYNLVCNFSLMFTSTLPLFRYN